MTTAKKQSLKKLSDDALSKRLDELKNSVREMSEEFDRDRRQEYKAHDDAMKELETEDLDVKLGPIEEETIAGLENQLGELLDTVERQEETLDRMDAEDAAEAEEEKAA